MTGARSACSSSCEVSLGSLGYLLAEDAADRRVTRFGLLAAVLLHAVLFSITWPNLGLEAAPADRTERVVYRVQPIRLLPPEQQLVAPQVPQTATVYIPDPDPQGPEIMREERAEPAVIDWGERGVIDDPLDIPPPPDDTPEAPPIVTLTTPPRVIYRVQPEYTQAAIGARTQGVVILQLQIDTEGRVAAVTVLRGLPFGLTENAVRAAEQWRFEPFMVNGRPVPALFQLSVRFNITGAS